MKIENLLEALPKTYTDLDRDLVRRAYRVAEIAHQDQKRASGEPYINHCLAVSAILAEMRVPPSVIAAGLLHDTVEDTPITLDDIKRDFGPEIAILVDGVTKLTQLPRVSRGDQHLEKDQLDEEQRHIAERRGQFQAFRWITFRSIQTALQANAKARSAPHLALISAAVA